MTTIESWGADVRGFRRVVPGEARRRAERDDGGDVDEHAAADAAEVRHHHLGRVEQALDVDGEQAIEVGFVDVQIGWRRWEVAALFTTISKPPSASSDCRSKCSTSAAHETSALTNVARPPAATTASATRRPPGSLMSATTTLAPSLI
jgi:hypothetical protein